MIEKLARISATASYSFGKLSPFANGITMTTVVAMYLAQATGMPLYTATAIAFIVLILVFCTLMCVVHFSGLFKAEQRYIIEELGLGKKKVI